MSDKFQIAYDSSDRPSEFTVGDICRSLYAAPFFLFSVVTKRRSVLQYGQIGPSSTFSITREHENKSDHTNGVGVFHWRSRLLRR